MKGGLHFQAQSLYPYFSPSPTTKHTISQYRLETELRVTCQKDHMSQRPRIIAMRLHLPSPTQSHDHQLRRRGEAAAAMAHAVAVGDAARARRAAWAWEWVLQRRWGALLRACDERELGGVIGALCSTARASKRHGVESHEHVAPQLGNTQWFDTARHPLIQPRVSKHANLPFAPAPSLSALLSRSTSPSPSAPPYVTFLCSIQSTRH